MQAQTGNQASQICQKKLSYKEKFELEKKRDELELLPGTIEELETELDGLQTRMSQSDYFKTAPDAMAADQKRLEQLEAQLETTLERWEELETALDGVVLD